MGGRGRMDHQAAGIADIGEMREDLHRLDEFQSSLVAALEAEGKDRASALGQVFLRQRIIAVGFETGIRDPVDLRVS